MKILLLNGPISDPTQPTLAIPALAAYLKTEGFDAVAWDISIDAFDMLTSEPFLSDAVQRIKNRKIDGDNKILEQFRKLSSYALVCAPMTLNNIRASKANMKDKEKFYKYTDYKNAMYTLRNAFDIVNAGFFPTKINFTSYELEKEQTVSNILQHISDPESNVFLEFFKTEVIPKIKTLNPAIIGISVTYLSQFLPSLTLCRMLKEYLPGVPVIIGGAFLTAISDRLAKMKFLWDLATGLVIYEGESALAEICSRIQSNKDLSGIPNLLLKDDPIPPPDKIHIEDIKGLPTPDFSGFPLDRYLVPEPVLPVQSCRGCYWGKCNFCSVSRATRLSHRQRPSELLLKDIGTLHSLYGANVFFICDDATSVNYMKILAEHIRDGKLAYRWGTEARFEKQLDDNTCELLAKGGCLHLIFGFESASNRVLDMMQKGTSILNIKNILKACEKANIGVNLQSFLGFPGETIDDAKATKDFFINNRELYTSLGLGHFKAVEGCNVVLQPNIFGVKIRDESREIIVPWYEIEIYNGISQKESFGLFKEMMDDLIMEDMLGPGLINGSSAAHGLLYLNHFGRSYVDSLGNEVYAWKGDVNEDICRIGCDVTIDTIYDNEWIVYVPTGSSHTVSNEVICAVRLLQNTPQSICSVAGKMVDGDILKDEKKIDEFSEIVYNLIYFIRRGLIECSPSSPKTDDGLQNEKFY